jgi:hypothetical protein
MARNRRPSASSDTLHDNLSQSSGERSSLFRGEDIDGSERGKIIVSLQTGGVADHDIMIHFAQDEFFQVWGYPESAFPMKLDRLYGEATKRNQAFLLQKCIITKKPFTGNMVLYRVDGMGMGCHLSLVSVRGDTPPSNDPLYQKDECWGVITIRSANAVGNSKFCGIGLLDPNRVMQQRLDEIGRDNSTDA